MNWRGVRWWFFQQGPLPSSQPLPSHGPSSAPCQPYSCSVPPHPGRVAPGMEGVVPWQDPGPASLCQTLGKCSPGVDSACRSALRTFKSLLKRASDGDQALIMNERGGSELLINPKTHQKGITVFAR